MKRILIISHKSPFAPIDGGVLAIRNLFLELKNSKDFEVDLYCLETDKHPHISKNEPVGLNITSFKIDTKIKPLEAFTHLISGKSYNTSRFYNKEFSVLLQNRIQSKSYDFVLFESLFSTVYFPDLKVIFKGKFLYRSHNIEHHIWQKLMKKETNPLKKWYLNTLTKSLKKYEKEIHDKLDCIFSISKSDLEYYKSNSKTNSYLLFFTRLQIARKAKVDPKSFFHLASMDWKPNLEAVDWFVNNVWKNIYLQDRDLKLYLAGKHMPVKYFNMKDIGIYASAYIENGDKFMQTHGTLIVPLFSGSGIRIKVVDALSLEVPVLSTDIGIDGIGLDKNLHFISANDKLEFQDRILKISKGSIGLNNIIANSKSFAHSNFDSKIVMAKFSEQLNKL